MADLESLDSQIHAAQAELNELAQRYHIQLGLGIPAYILAQVRHACTHEAAAQFLHLSETEQRRVIHLTQQLAASLGAELQKQGIPTTLTNLEDSITPYIAASERQLNQLLALEKMGSVTLKLFEAELQDQTLRSIKAQWQVMQARLAYLHRLRDAAQSKEQIQRAEERWQSLSIPVS